MKLIHFVDGGDSQVHHLRGLVIVREMGRVEAVMLILVLKGRKPREFRYDFDRRSVVDVPAHLFLAEWRPPFGFSAYRNTTAACLI